MRIVFAGTPAAAVPSLRRLIESTDHEIVAVVTRPDAPRGRGRTLQRSEVGAVADEAGITVLTPSSSRDPEFAEKIRKLQPQCCPIVAYGGLIPPNLLSIPEHGWINLHFSLLPAWRGAAPVNAAIAAGDSVTGASTFILDEGLDTGPILGTITTRISPTDTAGTLLERLSIEGAGLLTSTLDGIASGGLSGVSQPSQDVSYAPKISVEDARVRWDLPAHIVDRHIRSVTPYPGAWCEIGEQRIKLGSAQILADGNLDSAGTVALSPGSILVQKKAVLVGTATEPIHIIEVQPPGKKMMNATDWARGARLSPSTVAR